MEKSIITKEDRKFVFQQVKPIFKNKLGKYTHQRVSGDWHFHGLGFVREEMTYVFGFNIGFFKDDDNKDYDNVGMNVLIRLNGLNPKLRQKYANFFTKNLKDWYFSTDNYSSFRGGEGVELKRYKNLSDFSSKEEVVSFLKESIEKLSKIYPKIIENPDNIFDEVLRAAHPWYDSIIDVCLDVTEG